MAASNESAVGLVIVFAVALVLFSAIGLSASSNDDDSKTIEWEWIGPVGALAGASLSLAPGLVGTVGTTMLLFFVALTVPAVIASVDLGLLAAFLLSVGFCLGQQMPASAVIGPAHTILVVSVFTALLLSGLVTVMVRRKKNETLS